MDTTTDTLLTVNGMKCDGCIKRAREALSKLRGFVDADFDLKAGTVMFKGDVNPEAAIKALTDIGYPAALKGA